MTLRVDEEVYDVLAEGGSLTITLEDDDGVDGSLVAPCSLPGGCEVEGVERVEITFGGTPEQTGDTVTSDHDADTFVREVDRVYDDGTLSTSTSELDIVLT